MWKLLLLLLITGCSIAFHSEQPASARGTQYQVNFKSPQWEEKKEQRSDYVWVNNQDGRILLSNSFCEEFQDQPLEQLATKTFKMVSHLKIEKQNYTTFKNREAYRLKGTGKVDGVPVSLILLNTRRNNCYFDFVSINPQNSSIDVHQDFDEFLNSVEFK